MSGRHDPAIISFAELVLCPRFQVERNPTPNQDYALIYGFSLFFEIKVGQLPVLVMLNLALL